LQYIPLAGRVMHFQDSSSKMVISVILDEVDKGFAKNQLLNAIETTDYHKIISDTSTALARSSVFHDEITYAMSQLCHSQENKLIEELIAHFDAPTRKLSCRSKAVVTEFLRNSCAVSSTDDGTSAELTEDTHDDLVTVDFSFCDTEYVHIEDTVDMQIISTDIFAGKADISP
jgi:hypothetical protein